MTATDPYRTFANTGGFLMLDRLQSALLASVGLMSLTSCSVEDTPETLQGEPLVAGGDPEAVVLTIDDERFPAVFLSDENGSVNLGVYQVRTGSPALTIRDADNDGVFDRLTYSALSASGETLVDVEDYGMDGQPDFILNHQVPSASVFIDGTWYEADGVGTDSVTVEIDGKRVSLKEVVAELRGSN